ncbi:hypothetical protein PoB_001691600 [Plakobranchus ocellatus]|uniref:Uncharacterized protein n=1 Tax=Plakobranchus ocellatus TaxID=259542 RepID=A0AAV3YTI4_9GAST|nr:hypothetical protein PoB_001691600 [Plakobranchus ocellatus]
MASEEVGEFTEYTEYTAIWTGPSLLQATSAAPSLSRAKKADAGMIAIAPRRRDKDLAANAGPALRVTDNLQSEIKDGMLKVASGKALPVVILREIFACLPILRGEIRGREVDVMTDTGYEGLEVR